MSVNTHLKYTFFLLSIFFLPGCVQEPIQKDSFLNPKNEIWRTSSLLTDRKYFSNFSDSLQSVREQANFLLADSVLRISIQSENIHIPNDVLFQILKVYEKDFARLPQSEAFVNEEFAVCFLKESRFDSVLYYSNKARKIYEDLNEKESQARIEMIEAAALSFSGDFVHAQEHQLKALDIYKILGDSAGIYATLAEISINSFNEKDYHKTIELALRVLRYSESVKDSFLMGDMLNTLGSAYHQINKDQEAKKYIARSIQLRTNLKDDFGLSQAYGGMAMNEMAENNWEDALVWCGRAVEISEALRDYRNLAGLYYNIGACYMELNQPEKAEDAFRKVIKFSEESGLKDLALSRTYGRLAEILMRQKRTNEANEILASLVKLKDEIFSTEKIKITKELQTKYEIAEKEALLQRIEQDNKRMKEKRQLIILGLSLVSLLLLSLLVVFYQRNKNIRKLLITENKLKEEEMKLIQRELQYNREQLNDFTHHLVEKNRIIFDLEKKLVSGLKVNRDNMIVDQDDSSDMGNLLQLRILTDDDWTKFKIYFDKVFPGLIITLRQKHPDLTPAEERLFLLMKLKSDSREMSEILGISMESVRKNKYRLKKKLTLMEDTSLEEFIDKF
jgi:tetratricopeptide (TPR) repeat protein/DNA-binding CsgD family transcriptional regulator